jgi:hypothetical protein
MYPDHSSNVEQMAKVLKKMGLLYPSPPKRAENWTLSILRPEAL